MSTEPPPTYTIVFRTGQMAHYRIDKSIIEQIADDWKRGCTAGAYDVGALDGSYRKLVFRFSDLLYIG